jgi:hypothetical protein
MKLNPGIIILMIVINFLSSYCGGNSAQCNIKDLTDADVIHDMDLKGTDFHFETSADLSPEEIEIEEGEILPGFFLAPCEKNSDCLSGWCIESEDGFVCTKLCIDECPKGWDCKSIANMYPDQAFICVPASYILCKPCKNSKSCGNGLCLEIGGGKFCTRPCDEKEICPSGFKCAEIKGEETSFQCVPENNACDCGEKNNGEERPCVRQNKIGACMGWETCDKDKGWIDCTASEPYFETCDNIDNDCDGHTDEIFPDKWNVCFKGDGICKTAGYFACTKDGKGTECTAEEKQGKTEECNYLDDDCDGKTDEDFISDGKYKADNGCGNCFTDCTEIWIPSVHHANGKCDASGDKPFCYYECLEGFEDADGNPENGCELVLDPDAVYVSTKENGGSDTEKCGTVKEPCMTITFGIARAMADMKKKVLVSEGLYAGNVALADGIDLLGGYNSVIWQRDWNTNPTIITGFTQNAGDIKHKKAVLADSLKQASVFEGFIIYGENNFYYKAGDSGGNSYAVYVKNSGSNLEIKNNVIYAGSGSKGSAGLNGPSGTNGSKGSDGQSGFHTGTYFCAGTVRKGGAGGSSSCSSTGGTGADAICPFQNSKEGSGSQGMGSSGGSGGEGGYDFYVDPFYSCTMCVQETAKSSAGGSGKHGGDGKDGSAGEACMDGSGSVKTDEWTPESGKNADSGSDGSGGGGGGAGGGVDVYFSLFNTCVNLDTLGGAGGGGGSGGCGGDRGKGGNGGGASIGIFVLFSGSNLPSDPPVIKDNVVYRNQGGDGGSGGNGGDGGNGGNGGSGGGISDLPFQYCVGPGGHGASGGKGGNGGGGGGGCGGISFGIFTSGLSGSSPDYCDNASGNKFDKVGSSGQGGQGGNSSGNPGNAGAKGVEGDCKIN